MFIASNKHETDIKSSFYALILNYPYSSVKFGNDKHSFFYKY